LLLLLPLLPRRFSIRNRTILITNASNAACSMTAIDENVHRPPVRPPLSGAAIGGIVAGGLVLVAVVVCCLRRRRRQSSRQRGLESSQSAYAQLADNGGAAGAINRA
jgi:hypothetical protein